MILPAFLQNPLVIGSLGLSAGSVIGYARNIPKTISGIFKRHFTCSIQVSNMDDEDTFQLLRRWLSCQEYAKRSKNLTAVYSNEWMLTPAPGNHIFWFEGHPVWLNRDRGNANADLKTQAFKFPETLTIRVMTRNLGVIHRLCEQISEFARSLKVPDGHMRVYCTEYNSWYLRGTRFSRPLESVVLPEGQMERITSDLEQFWSNEAWYRKTGIPHRRGWLLQGIPGTGKTSLVSALAGHYKRDVYILSLSEPDSSDTRLIKLVSDVRNGSILLLEDIDAAFKQREDKKSIGITFSGLLNALDGVASPDGIVTIMTTNHPEKLDPALIRPGRVDQIMEFSAATDEQLTRLYKKFTSGDNPEGFIESFRGKTVAQAQEYLLKIAA